MLVGGSSTKGPKTIVSFCSLGRENNLWVAFCGCLLIGVVPTLDCGTEYIYDNQQDHWRPPKL